jgi:hypothetical protein
VDASRKAQIDDAAYKGDLLERANRTVFRMGYMP